MEPRVQRVVGLLLLLAVALAVVLRARARHAPSPRAPAFAAGLNYSRLLPANATLGFGAVAAVSRARSPRQEYLLFAANLTGLQLTIPDQPVWTDADLARLTAAKDSRISRGSALAWLGHLNVLRWFLDSGLETAVILEDDVDWDIHLRTVQVPLVAENTRRLLGSHATYWGDLAAWEILYLGHCGDFFAADRFPDTPHELFADDTLLPHRRMHKKTGAFLDELGIPEQQRMVHRSRWPLCTFAYAVTRPSARRILTEFAAREPDGGCQAYDVRILEACRDHDYQCYSANPELFHHISAPSEIANVDSGIDDHGRLTRESVSGTTNIACGARSDSFFTKDPATLKYLQQEVGVKGHCLVDSMEHDASQPF